MAYRITYFRKGEKVMASVFMRSAAEAEMEASENLSRLAAERATITDTSCPDQVVSTVTHATRAVRFN
jgi:phosphoheptose isomerase